METKKNLQKDLKKKVKKVNKMFKEKNVDVLEAIFAVNNIINSFYLEVLIDIRDVLRKKDMFQRRPDGD